MHLPLKLHSTARPSVKPFSRRILFMDCIATTSVTDDPRCYKTCILPNIGMSFSIEIIVY